MAQLRPVDPTRPPSAFKRAMTAIALSKLGTWFYVKVASQIDPWLMRVSGGRINWYHNLKATPGCQLRQGGDLPSYRATEVDGPDRDRLYANAKQLYSGYSVYEDRVSGIRRAPVLRLTPA
ncbi:MAG TPA: nitroreductase/quinone reductase family protein [Solirubrobacteraceae bacterium]|nr:nitroreductase/quinone reductase family protein [Solirubrobacteraceae bacterium]